MQKEGSNGFAGPSTTVVMLGLVAVTQYLEALVSARLVALAASLLME